MVRALLGTKVQFEAGDGSELVQAELLGVHDTCGLFVQTERLVPIVIGRNSSNPHYCMHNRMWCSVPNLQILRDKDGCVTGATWNEGPPPPDA